MRRSQASDIPATQVIPSSGRPGTRELGPSDLSDTGSDTIGTAAADGLENDSDSAGTGEGRDAGGVGIEEGRDLSPDRVIGADPADDGSMDE
ncbi:MAG: hypothetical protein JWN73_2794 [Betaproteobacteria bacterium]|nr:hypothetical protein [Betaproteobacteria bacterium]